MAPLPILLLLVAGSDMPEPQDRQQLVPTTTAPVLTEAPPPIDGIGRLNWVVKGTLGPASLWTGVFTSTWGTTFNKPREYGDSGLGWVKRYGLRMSGIAVDNTLEAGMGAFWGEDPRYHRVAQEPFKSRLMNTVKMTVMANKNDGSIAPAYARYIGIGGGNAMSNMWRPDSQVTFGNTMQRIGEGFASRLLANMWDEFWPSVKNHMPFAKHM
jgi:hypothetical protein